MSAHDALETARATAAFKSHLDLHLDEEDAHLYRLVSERVPVPDQGKAVGIMSSTVPQERFVEVVAWIFPLMGHNDRENMTRIWQLVLPPPVFNRAKQLIQEAIGDDWAELTRRIPTGSCPQPSLLGPWLGIPQWVVLKRRLPSVRWWWILISAFGWGIQFPGMIPGLMLTRLLRQLGVPSCQ